MSLADPIRCLEEVSTWTRLAAQWLHARDSQRSLNSVLTKAGCKPHILSQLESRLDAAPVPVFIDGIDQLARSLQLNEADIPASAAPTHSVHPLAPAAALSAQSTAAASSASAMVASIPLSSPSSSTRDLYLQGKRAQGILRGGGGLLVRTATLGMSAPRATRDGIDMTLLLLKMEQVAASSAAGGQIYTLLSDMAFEDARAQSQASGLVFGIVIEIAYGEGVGFEGAVFYTSRLIMDANLVVPPPLLNAPMVALLQDLGAGCIPTSRVIDRFTSADVAIDPPPSAEASWFTHVWFSATHSSWMRYATQLCDGIVGGVISMSPSVSIMPRLATLQHFLGDIAAAAVSDADQAVSLAHARLGCTEKSLTLEVRLAWMEQMQRASGSTSKALVVAFEQAQVAEAAWIICQARRLRANGLAASHSMADA